MSCPPPARRPAFEGKGRGGSPAANPGIAAGARCPGARLCMCVLEETNSLWTGRPRSVCCRAHGVCGLVFIPVSIGARGGGSQWACGRGFGPKGRWPQAALSGRLAARRGKGARRGASTATRRGYHDGQGHLSTACLQKGLQGIPWIYPVGCPTGAGPLRWKRYMNRSLL